MKKSIGRISLGILIIRNWVMAHAYPISVGVEVMIKGGELLELIVDMFLR